MYQFKEMQKISILTYFHFLRNLDTRLTNLLKGLYMGGGGGGYTKNILNLILKI